MTQSSGPLSAAMLGFTITASFIAYQLLTDVQSPITRAPALMIVFVVLCPFSLISQIFSNIEVGTTNFYALWSVIGVLNGALYASVRIILQRRPGKARQ